MKIVLATHNTAKIQELTKGLHESLPQATVITLSDLKIDIEPEETGNTFEENAELKARFYFEKSGIPTIADDGGLVVDALGGAPGVRSSRWLGRAATDEELIDYCLKQMKGVPHEKRTAKMGTCLCFFDGKNVMFDSEFTTGYITEKASGWQRGFPYRAIFDAPDINHRFISVKRLAEKIRPEYHTNV